MMTAAKTKTRKAPSSAQEPCSVFEYPYRDAGNYKALGQVLLTGARSKEDMQTIRDAGESEQYFFAEQIHIPTL